MRQNSPAAGFVLAALFVSSSCTPKGNSTRHVPPVSELSSDAALARLFPDASAKKRVDTNLLAIWNALAPHNCGACHGAPGAAGWGKHQMPYWLLWKSQAVGALGVLDTGVSRANPRDMRLFAILSGEFGVQMPPVRGTLVPTDTVLLESLTTNDKTKVAAELTARGKTTADLARALGTQLVYANQAGVCFDRANTGADPFDESLCMPFTDLAAFASTWKGGAAESLSAWNATANKALGMNHYDTLEGAVEEEKPITLSNTNVIASVVKNGNETVYKLAGTNTVSFYVQVSPDGAILAFTETTDRTALAPRAFNLSDPGSAAGARAFYNDGMRYDPIFSTDFDFKAGTGFVVGASGVTGSDESKNLYFYRSTGTALEKVAFPNPVDDLAGYQTIAKISDVSQVSPKWAGLKDKYIIQGKRWRWFAVDVVKNTTGATTGVKRVAPSGTGTNGPICGAITGELGDRIRSFDTADSMISPDGRWLSLRVGGGLQRSLVLVSTRDCAVKHVPRIAGKTISAGKASFSHDGRYAAFHAFGVNGELDDPMAFHNLGLIRQSANDGKVSNVFVYDTQTGETRRLTSHVAGTSPYVALFPSFDRQAQKIYYHRHRKGAAASEIVVVSSPLSIFR